MVTFGLNKLKAQTERNGLLYLIITFMIQNKIDYIKRGAFDELYTPKEAIECILPYIPDTVKIIWECTAIENSEIVTVLKANGFEVIKSHIKDGLDFFEYEPQHYDLIITNPPYSLKDQFLKRAFELDKPFMMLLPITTLEGKKRSEMFQQHNVQVLIPSKRFNFIKEKKGSWFQTSWFTWKLNLKSDLIFMNV